MKYEHNCHFCKYLGEFKKYDLYYCNENINPHKITNYQTVLARFGDGKQDFYYGLHQANEDLALEEAKNRAIEEGYLKGDKMKTITVNVPPADIQEPRHFSDNVVLKEYIRENKNRTKDIPRNKIGLIQAFKIDPEWFNEDCVDVNFHKTKPFIVIVHSKARPGFDIFNLEKAEEVTYSKCEFVLEVLSGQKQRRKKYIELMPTREILGYYKDMYERTRRYYKDCDEIIQYHEIFDFEESSNKKVEAAYQKLEKLLIENEKKYPGQFTYIEEIEKSCEKV